MSTTPTRLLGAWSLVDWRVESLGNGRVTWPFGSDADGLLLYAPSGWMSATMSQRQRSRLSAASVRQADEASRARLVGEYLAYSGRWSIDGNSVVHEVTLSLNPVLIGTRQVREVAFLGDDLVLSATEAEAGQSRVHRLHWRRA